MSKQSSYSSDILNTPLNPPISSTITTTPYNPNHPLLSTSPTLRILFSIRQQLANSDLQSSISLTQTRAQSEYSAFSPSSTPLLSDKNSVPSSIAPPTSFSGSSSTELHESQPIQRHPSPSPILTSPSNQLSLLVPSATTSTPPSSSTSVLRPRNVLSPSESTMPPSRPPEAQPRSFISLLSRTQNVVSSSRQQQSSYMSSSLASTASTTRSNFSSYPSQDSSAIADQSVHVIIEGGIYDGDQSAKGTENFPGQVHEAGAGGPGLGYQPL